MISYLSVYNNILFYLKPSLPAFYLLYMRSQMVCQLCVLSYDFYLLYLSLLLCFSLLLICVTFVENPILNLNHQNAHQITSPATPATPCGFRTQTNLSSKRFASPRSETIWTLPSSISSPASIRSGPSVARSRRLHHRHRSCRLHHQRPRRLPKRRLPPPAHLPQKVARPLPRQRRPNHAVRVHSSSRSTSHRRVPKSHTFARPPARRRHETLPPKRPLKPKHKQPPLPLLHRRKVATQPHRHPLKVKLPPLLPRVKLLRRRKLPLLMPPQLKPPKLPRRKPLQRRPPQQRKHPRPKPYHQNVAYSFFPESIFYCFRLTFI